MTATYSGDPSTSTKDAVRFWIQDRSAPWHLQDEEINYVLTQFSNPMLAAAQCARALAAQYAAKPSKKVGDFSISWGELAKNFADLAASLQSEGQTFNLAPYAGGVSIADKRAVAANTDRPKPPFRSKQFDNPNGVNNTSEGAWDDGSGFSDGS